MKVSYFPGCTLKNKARDLDAYAYRVAETLGVTLEEIENMAEQGDFGFLTPVSEALPEYEKIVLAERNAYRVRNGMKVNVAGLAENEIYRVFDEKGEFLALGRQTPERLEIIKSFYGGA